MSVVPIDTLSPKRSSKLGTVITDLEADPSVNVVVFQSANPECFIALSTYRRQLNGQRCGPLARFLA